MRVPLLEEPRSERWGAAPARDGDGGVHCIVIIILQLEGYVQYGPLRVRDVVDHGAASMSTSLRICTCVSEDSTRRLVRMHIWGYRRLVMRRYACVHVSEGVQ